MHFLVVFLGYIFEKCPKKIFDLWGAPFFKIFRTFDGQKKTKRYGTSCKFKDNYCSLANNLSKMINESILPPAFDFQNDSWNYPRIESGAHRSNFLKFLKSFSKFHKISLNRPISEFFFFNLFSFLWRFWIWALKYSICYRNWLAAGRNRLYIWLKFNIYIFGADEHIYIYIYINIYIYICI